MIVTNLLCNKDINLKEIVDIPFYIKKTQVIEQYHHSINMRKDATTVLKALKDYYPEYFI